MPRNTCKKERAGEGGREEGREEEEQEETGERDFRYEALEV
jgi:hypothetical protein